MFTPEVSEKVSHILPHELITLKNEFEKIYKRYLRLKKKILDLQISIERKGHTSQFLGRLNRLKEVMICIKHLCISKYESNIYINIQSCAYTNSYIDRKV
jgi:hypothetical protein